jgi:hypothetical protein
VDQGFRSARFSFRDTADVIGEAVYQRSSVLRWFLPMRPRAAWLNHRGQETFDLLKRATPGGIGCRLGSPRSANCRAPAGAATLSVAGAGIGLLCALVGVGGGLLSVPVLAAYAAINGYGIGMGAVRLDVANVGRLSRLGSLGRVGAHQFFAGHAVQDHSSFLR